MIARGRLRCERGSSLVLFLHFTISRSLSLSCTQLTNVEVGVYTDPNEVVLLFFPESPQLSILFAVCPPFPFAHSRTNKNKTKTPAAHNLRTSHSSRSALALPLSLCRPYAFLPADPSSAYPKPKRIPENDPINETIARACRTVSHDFQHPSLGRIDKPHGPISGG